MWRFLLGGLFVAHGLVHAAVWAAPTKEGGMPFDPKHSWALSALGLGPSARSLAVALASWPPPHSSPSASGCGPGRGGGDHWLSLRRPDPSP
jgi:hypothetical protein